MVHTCYEGYTCDYSETHGELFNLLYPSPRVAIDHLAALPDSAALDQMYKYEFGDEGFAIHSLSHGGISWVSPSEAVDKIELLELMFAKSRADPLRRNYAAFALHWERVGSALPLLLAATHESAGFCMALIREYPHALVVTSGEIETPLDRAVKQGNSDLIRKYHGDRTEVIELLTVCTAAYVERDFPELLRLAGTSLALEALARGDDTLWYLCATGGIDEAAAHLEALSDEDAVRQLFWADHAGNTALVVVVSMRDGVYLDEDWEGYPNGDETLEDRRHDLVQTMLKRSKHHPEGLILVTIGDPVSEALKCYADLAVHQLLIRAHPDTLARSFDDDGEAHEYRLLESVQDNPYGGYSDQEPNILSFYTAVDAAHLRGDLDEIDRLCGHPSRAALALMLCLHRHSNATHQTALDAFPASALHSYVKCADVWIQEITKCI